CDYNSNETRNASSFRLPNNTRPLFYVLKVNTSIHEQVSNFNAQVLITINVLQTSSSITLHARQMLLLDVAIRNTDGSVYDSDLRFTYDSVTEFLTIFTSRDIMIGDLLVVDITYSGFLNDFNGRGFFRSSYVDTDTNETHWFASTQFQPIHARQAFPCYDEIRYRTPFEIEITHHRSYTALANMDEDRTEIDGEFQTTIFATSPPMPTFQVAFTISNLDYVAYDVQIDMRVYARPQAIALGQGDEGLALGYIFLNAMVDYFGFPYVLPKSFQIAMPEFSSAGANNWGLLSFQEDIILQTDDDPLSQHIREIRIAHEYSHNVFANLISPASWSYLWMNEGFATLYENVLNDIVFPGKRQWERFLIEYFDVAIAVDVYDIMPPLNVYVEAPEDIFGKFNFITYFKGALVLRMFHEAFSEPTWRKGLSYYTGRTAFASATPEDLFAGLQIAYDEDYPERNDSVDAFMTPWLVWNGFPVVTINRTADGLIVSQRGFRTAHNNFFSIPINYATASNRDFDNTAAEVWLMGEEMFIPRESASKSWEDDDWIIFNLRDTYYYITNYDDTLWDLITEAMMNDHESIHFLNRGTLFADLERFFTNNFDIRVTIYFELIESLPFEFHPHVWLRTNSGLLKIEQRLRGSESYPTYLRFLRNVLDDIYEETRFIEEEEIEAANVINRWSCLSGVENCLTDSLSILLEVMDTGSTSEVIDFRCNGFLTANGTVWSHFFNFALDLNPSRSRLNELTSLLCTQDEGLIGILLNATLSSNNLLQSEKDAIILAACTQSEISFNAAIQFIHDRHAAIIAEELDLVGFIRALSSVTNVDSHAERVLDLHRHIPADWNVDIEDFRQVMEPNREFFLRNSEGVRRWLEERIGATASA
ncbi:Aminopeptidase N, partial [Pseudolycoriella hygida]